MKKITFSAKVAKNSTRCVACHRIISKDSWYLRAKIVDDSDRAVVLVFKSIHDDKLCSSRLKVDEGVQKPDFYSAICGR